MGMSRPGELGPGFASDWQLRSGCEAVMEEYDAVAKAALVQQLELGIDAGGQGELATTHEDRPKER